MLKPLQARQKKRLAPEKSTLNKWVFLCLLITGIMLAEAGGLSFAQEPEWDKIVPIIIQIESNGNPYAVSKDGCIGLMQINNIVYKEWLENTQDENYIVSIGADAIHLFNPEYNREIGTWYLKRIWNHYLPHYKLEQSIENLLIAYNFGIGNLVKYRQGKIKLPKETRDYLKKYIGKNKEVCYLPICKFLS